MAPGAAPHLSIVLPFYNEEACVAEVLTGLHGTLAAAGFSFEIVAVENGSHDGTAAILERLSRSLPGLRVVTVTVNRGFGYGVTQGLATAAGEIIGYMPGDGQIAAAVVPALLGKMRSLEAHVAQGCRAARQDGLLRVWTSRIYNTLAALLFQLPTSDVNGHPKLIVREAYTAMKLRSRDDFLDAEIMLKAKCLGLRICSINVTFLKRRTGHSNVRLRTCFQFIRNMLAARFLRNDPWGLHALEPFTPPIRRARATPGERPAR